MGLSVIIPSRDASNLVPCVQAIWAQECTFDLRVIVVDDGAKVDAQHVLTRVTWVDGIKPFCFSRNVNLGILAAGNDDVIILNDDAVLKSPNGFTRLHQLATARKEFGVLSAVTNSVGNHEQMRLVGTSAIRELTHTACFICVLIRREVIDLVGLLDEEFRPAYFEDDDYCTRCVKAGFKLGAWDGCFVDHLALKSTGRSGRDTSEEMFRSLVVYERKHGTHPRVPLEWRRRMQAMGIGA